MSSAASPIDEERRRGFERQWLQQGATPIEEFLPDASDPRFEATLLELVCIDMEMRYRHGDPPSVSDYVRRFEPAARQRDRLVRERDYLARRHVTAGSRIGRYELRAVIGTGAFAEVWRAFDPDLAREVALKRLRPELGEDEQAQARFQREARSAARLRHPAIVTVHEVGADACGPFLVSDLIPGPTLAQAMEDREFSADQAATIAARVADALDYAHQCGVVHRDVKPSNVLMDEAGRPLLTDFGLAHLAATDATLTRRGDVLGTPAYMSPEQVLGDVESIDERSDVFSLGVVLYTLICGKTPFHGETPTALSYAVVHRDAPPPRRVRVSTPADLETICLKAIAREPDRRYATAGAMADDLRRFLAREPIHARRRGPVARLALWTRRNPALALSLLAVVTVGGVALARILKERAATRANLYRSLVREAEAHLALPKGAGREAAWKSIGEAAAVDTDVRDSLELRTLALRYLTAQGPHFRRLGTWTGPEQVAGIALARDGARVFETGPGGTYARTPETGLVIASDPMPALSIERDPTGKRIAVGGRGTVRLLDTANLRELATIECARDVEALSFSGDGRRLASGGSTGPVEVWDVSQATPSRLHSLPHKIHSLALGPGGAQIAFGDTESRLHLVRLDTNEVVWTYTFRDPVRAIAWGHPALAVVVWENLRVNLVDIATGGMREPQGAHDAAVRAVFFDPLGNVITASADGALAAWNKELARVAETRVGGTELETAATGGGAIMTLDSRSRRTLWRIVRPTGRTTWASHHGAVFIPGSQRLFAGDAAIEFKNGDARATRGPALRIQTWGVAVDAQGRRVARTSHAGRVILCDARTLEIEHELLASGPVSWRTTFHPDGETLAAGSGNEIALFETESGHDAGRLKGHTGMVAALAFHPSGRLLASASRDKTLRIWDWKARREVARRLEGVVVHDLIYRGDSLLAACGDGTLRIWRDGTDPVTVNVSDSPVWAVGASPDGTIATGSQAGGVRLWDPTSWRVIAALHDVRRVRYLSFDDSGRYLAASVYLGDGALWDLTWLRAELEPLGLDWK
ncbi:MAG: WD40 repeat domain-containing serine/threonine-protein kinase [Planctomycetota bacterium]